MCTEMLGIVSIVLALLTLAVGAIFWATQAEVSHPEFVMEAFEVLRMTILGTFWLLTCVMASLWASRR